MCRQREPGRSRRGYTLLEVLLAMAIAVLLLGGLYTAMNIQLHHAESGREVVQQATLARALLSRIRQDIAAATNLPDASRYRLQSTQNNSQGGGGSGQSGAAGNTGAAGTAGGTSTPASGAAGGTTTGNSSTNNSSTNNSSTSNPSTTGGLTAADGTMVTWVYGIQGDSATLNLFVSKLPEVLAAGALTGDMQAPLVSDLRRVSYWMADATNGLARQEVKVETAQDIANLPPNVSDDGTIKYTPEVRNIQFSYFDGTNWQDSWDSTTLGADGLTPIGPPRAVAVQIDVVQPRGGEAVKSYRHVVFIPSANGATTMQQPTGNTGGGN